MAALVVKRRIVGSVSYSSIDSTLPAIKLPGADIDPTKTILLLSIDTIASGGFRYARHDFGYTLSANELQFIRNEYLYSSLITISYTLIEFESGVNVQHLNLDAVTDTNNTIDLTGSEIVVARTLPLINGIGLTTTSHIHDLGVDLSTDTVTFVDTRGLSGTAHVDAYVQLVEFDSGVATVQHGNATIAKTGTVTITSVDTSRSIAAVYGSGGSTGGVRWATLSELSSSTTIDIDAQDYGSAVSADYNWHVCEFADGTAEVERGSVAFATDDETKEVTLSKRFINAAVFHTGGAHGIDAVRTDASDSDTQQGSISFSRVLGSDLETLTIHRGLLGPIMTVGWQVLRFPTTRRVLRTDGIAGQLAHCVLVDTDGVIRDLAGGALTVHADVTTATDTWGGDDFDRFQTKSDGTYNFKGIQVADGPDLDMSGTGLGMGFILLAYNFGDKSSNGTVLRGAQNTVWRDSATGPLAVGYSAATQGGPMTTTPAANTRQTIAINADYYDYEFYYGLQGSSVIADGTDTNAGYGTVAPLGEIGGWAGQGHSTVDAFAILAVNTWFDLTDINAIHDDPVNELFEVEAAPGGGGVTGTLTATESGADTASITGAVTASGIAGTLTATETGGDTGAVAGAVIVAGDLVTADTGADTASATGAVLVAGDLAANESGADTASAAGTVPVVGAMAATEAGADTASITGTAPVVATGTLTATESGADTGSISGAVAVSGALVVAEAGQDSFSATAGAQITGYADLSESGADTGAMAGVVPVSGALAATEAGADTASITGSAPSLGEIVGDLAATEAGADTGAISGAVAVSGVLVVAEAGQDGFNATAGAQITGYADLSESGADTGSISGAVAVSGDLAVTEVVTDSASISGAVLVTGIMTAAESGADLFTATETAIAGLLAAAEAGNDSLFAMGQPGPLSFIAPGSHRGGKLAGRGANIETLNRTSGIH